MKRMNTLLIELADFNTRINEISKSNGNCINTFSGAMSFSATFQGQGK
jgi:hypothetical protein